jgi:hypothetical protein
MQTNRYQNRPMSNNRRKHTATKHAATMLGIYVICAAPFIALAWLIINH